MNTKRKHIEFTLFGYFFEFRIFIWNKKKWKDAEKRIDDFIKVNEYGFIF